MGLHVGDVGDGGGWHPSATQLSRAVQFPLFLSLLACVWALDIFWAAMIARMIYKLVVLAELDDDRSDTEEDQALRNRGRTKEE